MQVETVLKSQVQLKSSKVFYLFIFFFTQGPCHMVMMSVLIFHTFL